MSIVSFKIGRGGRFHNPGHRTFYGVNDINHFTSNLFVTYQNLSEVTDKIGNRSNLSKLLHEANHWINHKTEAKERLTRHGLDLGKLIWVDGAGHDVGLDFENDGTGMIDIDGDYETYIATRIEDTDEAERLLIVKAGYGTLLKNQYDTFDIFEAFDIFEDMVRNDGDIAWSGISLVSKEEAEEVDDYRIVNGTYYVKE